MVDEEDKIRRLRLKELEAEKLRVKEFHEEEERRLMAELKLLEEEEEERLRLLKLWQDENQLYEHFADGEADINQFTDSQLDAKCDELFLNNRPIPFVPRKGNNYKLE